MPGRRDIDGRRISAIVAGAFVLTSSFTSAAAAYELPVTMRIEDAPAPADPSPPDGPATSLPAPPDTDTPAPPPAAPAPEAPTASDPLPRTGSDFSSLLRNGTAAFAAGLLVLLATRPSVWKERS